MGGTTSVSRFDATKGVVGGKHPRQGGVLGVKEVWCLRLAFRGEGGGGGWKTPSVTSKRETGGVLDVVGPLSRVSR